jgi:aldose 1-epimerase
MYSILKEPFGSYEKYTLLNQQTKEYVSVIPAYGGNVMELVLAVMGKKYSVLDGNKTEHELTEDESYKGAHLVPFSGRIRQGVYKFRGIKYQLPINKPDEGHALHGFLNDKPFEVVNVSEEKDFSALELSYDYDGNIPGYPFPFRLGFLYKLSSDGFKIETLVINKGVDKMPYSYGWHPYFTFNETVDELYLQLPATGIVALNEHLIPTGKILPAEHFIQPEKIGNRLLDTCFVVENKKIVTARLYSAKHDIPVNIWQEAGEGKFRYMQVYTPPHRNSIAIEPVTSQPNSFNRTDDLIVLNPGETYATSCGINLG